MDLQVVVWLFYCCLLPIVLLTGKGSNTPKFHTLSGPRALTRRVVTAGAAGGKLNKPLVNFNNFGEFSGVWLRHCRDSNLSSPLAHVER